MLKFIRLMTHALPLPDDDVLVAERAEMKGVAERARARLQERGLLEAELEVQRAIAERVREARKDARAAA